ncbi:hypothetical protein [Paracoccus methylarcula]|uniref:Uncharacterized protein n=1 Tax=Paracoccus methylarcula TaxID=72022 RepID=A0A422QYE7_9RHOB|nr:hypothetical protein [Paracoccus methylarcula]RNF34991.1 hypothetical protein A7A09_008375 [Paracoccus methylarcula]
MNAEIRAATLPDLPSMVELLMQDAERRQAHDPALWVLANDARSQIADAVTFALTAEKQPFRQQWLVAEADGRLVGIIHDARLPVPPIYAGKWGDPGLLMPESFVTRDAPEGTLDALIDAAEADLRALGARILLASFVCGGEWHESFRGRGYEPLTLYMSRSGLDNITQPSDVRAATDRDMGGIVARSAENGAVLHQLDAFWAPHPEADARFGAWMRKSLTFTDRDMLVIGDEGGLDGYVVAQPASRLHFPPAHDISATGVIDDFFHRQYADPVAMQKNGAGGQALLQAAEASFTTRGITTAFAVCPAAWTSKIALLESVGYRTAMVWMIKR